MNLFVREGEKIKGEEPGKGEAGINSYGGAANDTEFIKIEE